MRNVINISLPEELTRQVQKEVKMGNYASTSEFFRHLLRTHKLAEELKLSKRDFEIGKGKTLHSLRDLR